MTSGSDLAHRCKLCRQPRRRLRGFRPMQVADCCAHAVGREQHTPAAESFLLKAGGRGRFRSVRFDSIRFDSIRSDSIRFGSVRFGSVRFGSVRFGSVRFRASRFDSVRFGSVPCESVRFDLGLGLVISKALPSAGWRGQNTRIQSEKRSSKSRRGGVRFDSVTLTRLGPHSRFREQVAWN